MGGTRLRPPDLGQLIETVELVNGAVTTLKLADNSVTNAKIATHVSTKITGLATQTQPFLLDGNAINLSTITLQQVANQAVLTVPDEDLAGFKIQNNNGSVELINATGAVGNFSPALIFNSGGDERAVGQIIAKIPALEDTGLEAAIRIAGRLDDNSVLITRPVVAFYNFNVKVSQIEADGTQNILGNKINLSDITLQQVGIKAEIKIPDSSSGGGLKVGDNNGFVQLINGTGTVGAFLPTIQMRTNNATKPALIIGELETGTDVGTQPALVLECRIQGPSAVTTRPIRSIQNHITKVFEIAADGTQDFQGNKLTGIGTNTITDLTPVTGAAGDFVWIIDATDGLSKKVDVSDFLGDITGDLDLVDGSTIRWAGVANRRITNTGAGFALEVEAGDNFTLQIASQSEYTFDSTQADFKDNNIINLNELKWRNNADTADLVLRVDASDQLIFDDTVISIPAGAKTEGPVSFLNNAETQFLILDTNATDQLTFEGNVIPIIKSGSISSIAEGSTSSVVFAAAYTNTPKVIVSFNENTDFTGSSISITTVSNTGFTVRYDRSGSGPMTAAISWIAVE